MRVSLCVRSVLNERMYESNVRFQSCFDGFIECPPVALLRTSTLRWWRATQDTGGGRRRWTPKRSSVIIYQLQLQIVSNSQSTTTVECVWDEARAGRPEQNWFLKGAKSECCFCCCWRRWGQPPNNKRTCPAKLKLISVTLVDRTTFGFLSSVGSTDSQTAILTIN